MQARREGSQPARRAARGHHKRMETTLGIDLASQSRRTALCVIAWDHGRADVQALACGTWDGHPLDDRLLCEAIAGLARVAGGWGEEGYPVKAAIDAPFGWPQPFVEALAAHHQLQPWPGSLGVSRERFERRAPDLFVRQHAKKLPLSVSTDRIAYCAMRCAVILGDLAERLEPEQVARDGSGRMVEAYPDAALRCWLPGSWIQRCVQRHVTIEPQSAEHAGLAKTEGWIHLPEPAVSDG